MKRAQVWSINLYHLHHLVCCNMEDLELLERTRYSQENYATTSEHHQLLQGERF
jgi:hypothetical protein